MEESKVDLNYAASFVQPFLRKRYGIDETFLQGGDKNRGAHMWFEGDGKFHLLMFLRDKHGDMKDEVRIDIPLGGTNLEEIVTEIINGVLGYDNSIYLFSARFRTMVMDQNLEAKQTQ